MNKASIDTLPLALSIALLAMASLAAVVVILLPAIPMAGLAVFMMTPYVFLPCFAAALGLVLPFMVVFPRLRRPGYVIAAAWGTLCAWCAVVLIFERLAWGRWEVILPYGAAGALAGLLYSRLARVAGTPETDAETSASDG